MIKAENISLSFDGLSVLTDFSVTLENTGITCLFGPSGCGKTSLARVIAGLQRPDGGKVTGISPGESAFVFQEDRLLPWLTAEKNITAVSGDAEVTKALLNKVCLNGLEDKYPSQLSGGEKRRVSLARALSYEKAKLLILDEPFTGMDEELKGRLCPVIMEYSLNKPVLLITHDIGEAEALKANIVHIGK